MKIQTINQVEFNQINASRQVITHEYPRQFAILDFGNNLEHYGISWNSNLIEPMVKLSPDGQTVWVGVEQKLAAICTQTGKILLALPLTSYLVQMLTLEKVTAAITEEEFLLFNRRGSIRSHKALPDTAIGMSLVEGDLAIKLLEGECLTINPETGSLKKALVLGMG
jgi:hypothetical protein